MDSFFFASSNSDHCLCCCCCCHSIVWAIKVNTVKRTAKAAGNNNKFTFSKVKRPRTSGSVSTEFLPWFIHVCVSWKLQQFHLTQTNNINCNLRSWCSVCVCGWAKATCRFERTALCVVNNNLKTWPSKRCAPRNGRTNGCTLLLVDHQGSLLIMAESEKNSFSHLSSSTVAISPKDSAGCIWCCCDCIWSLVINLIVTV